MSFQQKLFTYSLGEHKGMDIIWIHFEKNEKFKMHLREYVTAFWSQSNTCWYCRDIASYRELFGLAAKHIGKNAVSKIDVINQPEFERFRALLELKAYSPNTIRTYLLEFAQFLYVLKQYPATDITPDQLKSYCLYCIRTLKLSENQMHSRINALKFYFEQVLKNEKIFLEIPRPNKPLLLPKALNLQEIKRLFEVVDNAKHRLLLRLCYGMGLRVSEIVQLKLTDIDSINMQVRIERAKGKKDRIVNLPQTILLELRAYFSIYKPKFFLFEGQYEGTCYSVRSAQSVFKQAMLKAKINKNVGIHSLRHSYATHLLESGIDISYIQKLLGHNNIKTTLIYTQITNREIKNIGSPLDNL